MSGIAQMRLQREVSEIVSTQEIKQTGIKVAVIDECLNKLNGEIRGPPDTPYAEGVFQLSIVVSDAYPFKPPAVRFTTKVWHPNVSSVTGAICLDVLKDQWAASMTLRSVLLCIQALLSSPEPKDPQDAVVARQTLENRHIFDKTATFWAQEYAGATGPKDPDFETKIEMLTYQKISRENSIRCLSSKDWNVDCALAEALA